MRYRLTGIGTPFGSLSFEKKDDDREIARRAISLLEDHRVLYKDMHWEVPGRGTHSADRARAELTDLIANADISDGLAQQLKLLRSYFREFVSQEFEARRDWKVDSRSIAAVDELRVKVGTVVGDLSARFDLDVEPELATIIPVDEGGFFEQVLQ